MKKSTSISPYLSKKSLILNSLLGNIAKRILDPSRGGMGTRLKIASTIFIKTIMADISRKPDVWAPAKRRMSPNMTAIKILEAGPAKATAASDHLPGRRLYGLYGTGFAQPKINPPREYAIRGTRKEPKKSRCFIGLRVSLPWYFAVWSPSMLAA